MSFLNAWAIAIGATALLAPLAVHFLTKPRPVTFSLSTIRLLREVIEERRARSRIRDWLVLLLRMIAIGLLAMALARPIWRQNETVAAEPSGNASRVILLDVSQSMSAGAAGSTALQQAQAVALRYLAYAADMEADLILVGASPRGTFGRLSTNLSSLRESVRQAEVRPERANVKTAMEEAGRLLENSGGTRELVVISDFQRGNWSSLFLDLIPEQTQVQFESVAPDETANLAITAVRLPSQPIVGKKCPIEVEIANHSDQEAEVRCQLSLGELHQTFEGRVAPQTTGVLSSVAEFSNPGWFGGWAQLEANLDVLPADDVRPVAVHVTPPPRVLLISRQPLQKKPSSSFYLEQALRIIVARENISTATDQSVQRVQPQRIDVAGWSDADLLLLNHPGTLDVEVLKQVATRIRRGKALLYVTSELADGVNLQRLAEILGSGFQPPVQLVSPPEGTIRKNLFVRSVNGRQPPFQVFGDAGASSLRAVRFGGGLATRATSEGLRDQALAELSDSSTLLYRTSCDAGLIAVLNADLDQSNWCVQPTFLPVLSELVQSLLSGRSQPSETFCGEPVVRLLPSDVSIDAKLAGGAVNLRTPPAAEYGRWEWSASQGSLVWSWADPPGAGLYQLTSDGQPVVVIATATPPAEADLRTLDRTVIGDRLAGSRKIGYRDRTDEDQSDDNLWNWLIVGCVLAMAGEICALRRFRS